MCFSKKQREEQSSKKDSLVQSSRSLNQGNHFHVHQSIREEILSGKGGESQSSLSDFLDCWLRDSLQNLLPSSPSNVGVPKL